MHQAIPKYQPLLIAQNFIIEHDTNPAHNLDKSLTLRIKAILSQPSSQSSSMNNKYIHIGFDEYQRHNICIYEAQIKDMSQIGMLKYLVLGDYGRLRQFIRKNNKNKMEFHCMGKEGLLVIRYWDYLSKRDVVAAQIKFKHIYTIQDSILTANSKIIKSNNNTQHNNNSMMPTISLISQQFQPMSIADRPQYQACYKKQQSKSISSSNSTHEQYHTHQQQRQQQQHQKTINNRNHSNINMSNNSYNNNNNNGYKYRDSIFDYQCTCVTLFILAVVMFGACFKQDTPSNNQIFSNNITSANLTVNTSLEFICKSSLMKQKYDGNVSGRIGSNSDNWNEQIVGILEQINSNMEGIKNQIRNINKNDDGKDNGNINNIFNKFHTSKTSNVETQTIRNLQQAIKYLQKLTTKQSQQQQQQQQQWPTQQKEIDSQAWIDTSTTNMDYYATYLNKIFNRKNQTEMSYIIGDPVLRYGQNRKQSKKFYSFQILKTNQKTMNRGIGAGIIDYSLVKKHDKNFMLTESNLNCIVYFADNGEFYNGKEWEVVQGDMFKQNQTIIVEIDTEVGSIQWKQSYYDTRFKAFSHKIKDSSIFWVPIIYMHGQQQIALL